MRLGLVLGPEGYHGALVLRLLKAKHFPVFILWSLFSCLASTKSYAVSVACSCFLLCLREAGSLLSVREALRSSSFILTSLYQKKLSLGELACKTA